MFAYPYTDVFKQNLLLSSNFNLYKMEKTYNQAFRKNQKVTRISWAAIFAGALTAIIIAFMLNMLGLGIGLTSINPMSEENTLDGLGTGTIIWWALSNLVALFVGGLIAGRMSGFPSNKDGGLHGFLAWALFTLVSVWLLTATVGGILSGVSNTFSSLLGGSDTKDLAEQIANAKETGKESTMTSFEGIKEQALKLVNQAESTGMVSDDASSETKESINEAQSDSKEFLRNLNLEDNIDEFFNKPNFDLDNEGNLDISVEGGEEFVDKEAIKNYLTENTELSEEEINGVITKWEEKINTAIEKAETLYKEAKQTATEYAEKTAQVAGTISIVAFFIFLLGALAAFFGGTAGSPKYTVDEERPAKTL